MRLARLLPLLAALASPLLFIQTSQADSPVHTVNALALLGEPKYGPDFKHFDWVNPDAPRGGEIHLATVGSFDTFNPFSFKGVAASGIGALFETLMVPNPDEPDTEYGLIAQSVEIPEDRSWVAFNIRPEARWQDGKSITADDVVFTFNILREKGDPQYALYYADVTKVETLSPLKVKFTFKNGSNRELAQILGQLPVLPKHYWEGKTFEDTTLVPPLGSGPYKVDSFESPRYIIYRRDPNYWGWKLPVKIGRDNYDVMRIDYYKDPNVEHIAFLAGAFDYTVESSAKVWATGYETAAKKDGRLILTKIPDHSPAAMQCFVFNIRRDMFKDRRVRQALGYAFDFEWSNKTLFYGQYFRTKSFFDNSELAATGLPSADELKILEPLRGKIPDEVFTQEFKLPMTDGSGNNRANLREASALLDAAGWVIKDGKRVNKDTGKPLSFEILLDNPLFERISLPFAQSLKRLGVDMIVHTVDDTQYQQRVQTFDFDMIVYGFGESLSPGNEQRYYWGSTSADTPASPNVIGIKDPAIDSLIDQIIATPDRAQLIIRTRALDRVLLWNYFVIPHFHLSAFRIAYWNRFGMPAHPPLYAPGLDAWWVDPGEGQGVGRARTELRRPMLAYLIRRLLLIVPTLLGILALNFFIIQVAPGGPVEQLLAKIQGNVQATGARITGGGSEVTSSTAVTSSGGQAGTYRGSRGLDPAFIERIKKYYGFDKPIYERFLIMLRKYATFDFGKSFYRDTTVVDLVIEKMPVSISIGLWTTLITYMISIPLGIAKAVRNGSHFDSATSTAIIVGNAIPAFLFAILLIIVFAGGHYLNWFPLRGLVSDNWHDLSWPARILDYFKHMALPLTAMSVGAFATLTMLTKNSFLEQINQQYVLTARAKGLTERRVLYGHVFRNAMLIVIGGFPAAFIGILFGGAVLIEIIFSLDGLGLLGYDALIRRDYPVLFANLYVFGLLGLLMNIVGDFTYTLVDPRLDFESRDT